MKHFFHRVFTLAHWKWFFLTLRVGLVSVLFPFTLYNWSPASPNCCLFGDVNHQQSFKCYFLKMLIVAGELFTLLLAINDSALRKDLNTDINRGTWPLWSYIAFQFLHGDVIKSICFYMQSDSAVAMQMPILIITVLIYSRINFKYCFI